MYKIKCLCDDYYIGETGRTTNTRVKEHKAACRLTDLPWQSMPGRMAMSLNGMKWKC